MKRIAVIIVKEKTGQKSTTARVDSSMIDLIFVMPRFFFGIENVGKYIPMPTQNSFLNQKLREVETELQK